MAWASQLSRIVAPLVLLLACDSPKFMEPPADTRSLDYHFTSTADLILQSENGWSDSSAYVVRLERPVRGVTVRFRATLGGVTPDVITSDLQGRVFTRWGVLPELMPGDGELWACVVAADGCVDQRLATVSLTAPN